MIGKRASHMCDEDECDDDTYGLLPRVAVAFLFGLHFLLLSFPSAVSVVSLCLPSHLELLAALIFSYFHIGKLTTTTSSLLRTRLPQRSFLPTWACRASTTAMRCARVSLLVWHSPQFLSSSLRSLVPGVGLHPALPAAFARPPLYL